MARSSAVAALTILMAGCRSAAPPPPPATPARPFDVAKMRESLQVAPLEVVFSGVRGQANADESVAITNVGSESVQITGLEIAGPNAATFKLSQRPNLPYTLAPSKRLSVTIGFAPPPDATIGVHRAMLHVFEGGGRDEGPPVDVSGLVAKGKQGENEPPLQQVVEALGFAVDVGSPKLSLGTGADPVGDEIKSPRFVRARATSVSLYPVARYSPDEPIPYGYYSGGTPPELHPLATIAAGQEQTLNPDLEPDGKTTFDPGTEAFGLYVKSAKHSTYTDDALNTVGVRHAARVYPLKSRGGARIPDAYLIGFEEAQNGDYNDYVFVLWNVKAVTE